MDPVVETRTFPRLGETLGRVGSDAFGAGLKARLAAEGIATGGVHETPGVSTGIAAIAADLDAAEPAFAEADVVLAQLEVPLATVEHGAELAARGAQDSMPTLAELNAFLDPPWHATT
jgi:sugar/nucleoside kinase (ribokinase family)